MATTTKFGFKVEEENTLGTILYPILNDPIILENDWNLDVNVEGIISRTDMRDVSRVIKAMTRTVQANSNAKVYIYAEMSGASTESTLVQHRFSTHINEVLSLGDNVLVISISQDAEYNLKHGYIMGWYIDRHYETKFALTPPRSVGDSESDITTYYHGFMCTKRAVIAAHAEWNDDKLVKLIEEIEQANRGKDQKSKRDAVLNNLSEIHLSSISIALRKDPSDSLIAMDKPSRINLVSASEMIESFMGGAYGKIPGTKEEKGVCGTCNQGRATCVGHHSWIKLDRRVWNPMLMGMKRSPKGKASSDGAPIPFNMASKLKAKMIKRIIIHSFAWMEYVKEINDIDTQIRALGRGATRERIEMLELRRRNIIPRIHTTAHAVDHLPFAHLTVIRKCNVCTTKMQQECIAFKIAKKNDFGNLDKLVLSIKYGKGYEINAEDFHRIAHGYNQKKLRRLGLHFIRDLTHQYAFLPPPRMIQSVITNIQDDSSLQKAYKKLVAPKKDGQQNKPNDESYYSVTVDGFSSKGNRSKVSIVTKTNGKDGFVRSKNGKSALSNNARVTMTAGVGNMEEITIPRVIANELYVLESTYGNLDKLQKHTAAGSVVSIIDARGKHTRLPRKLATQTWFDAQPVIKRADIVLEYTIDLINFPVKREVRMYDPANVRNYNIDRYVRGAVDGDIMILTRNPTISVGGVVALRVKVSDVATTIWVHPSVIDMLRGDYDGDEGNLYLAPFKAEQETIHKHLSPGNLTMYGPLGNVGYGLHMLPITMLHMLSKYPDHYYRVSPDILASYTTPAFARREDLKTIRKIITDIKEATDSQGALMFPGVYNELDVRNNLFKLDISKLVSRERMHKMLTRSNNPEILYKSRLSILREDDVDPMDEEWATLDEVDEYEHTVYIRGYDVVRMLFPVGMNPWKGKGDVTIDPSAIASITGIIVDRHVNGNRGSMSEHIVKNYSGDVLEQYISWATWILTRFATYNQETIALSADHVAPLHEAPSIVTVPGYDRVDLTVYNEPTSLRESMGMSRSFTTRSTTGLSMSRNAPDDPELADALASSATPLSRNMPNIVYWGEDGFLRTHRYAIHHERCRRWFEAEARSTRDDDEIYMQMNAIQIIKDTSIFPTEQVSVNPMSFMVDSGAKGNRTKLSYMLEGRGILYYPWENIPQMNRASKLPWTDLCDTSASGFVANAYGYGITNTEKVRVLMASIASLMETPLTTTIAGDNGNKIGSVGADVRLNLDTSWYETPGMMLTRRHE